MYKVTLKRNLRLPEVLAFILLAFACSVNAAGLMLTGDVMAWGGSCEPGPMRIIAGSNYFLSIENSADQPASALVPGWPVGYTLEAAMDLAPNSPFVVTTGLTDSLHPVRFIDPLNQTYEYSLLHHDTLSLNLAYLNAKYIVLHIPANLAGHTLSFRAFYNHEAINLQSNVASPILIIAPCDRSDTSRIVASWIYAAWRSLNYLRGIDIADSMLAVGLTDAGAWYWGKLCATSYHEYDKILAYLDRIYEDFDVVSMMASTATPPQRFTGGQHNPDVKAAYDYQRSEYIKAKTAHEQEH